ncbi:vacuolar protein sorting 38-like [Miscanthus floridulus]|uniref:vacuolar protein sorting 38-like n=1 Tax=Miscanthus floridulus TaxID=154761 RepID=UPI00345AE8CD
MEDPAPSSAAPDPPLHPPPSTLPHPQPPEEEGDGWVLVPASEVEGAHAPKVIHWDDLQQELARLWSLSAALQPAGDRKAHLAARLESALQVRQECLEQDNELAEMRQRLQEHTDRLGDLKLRTKKLSEDVVDQREQLCVKIRTLSVASKALDAAHGNLKEANKLLSGENGCGHLKNLEQKLRMRQQYMIAQVAQIYPVSPLDEQSPDHKPGFTSNITKTRNAESGLPNGSQNRPLVILGLQLSKLSMKKTGYFSDKTEVQKSYTVLGYAAHAVSLIASYLNVPLRYPLRFGGSRSYVLVPAPSVQPSSITSVATSVPPSTSMRTMEFPLFLDSQETTRSAYAIFLLNKDIEQLLNYIGAESLGPRHVLANLRQLTRIIQSQEYTSVD